MIYKFEDIERQEIYDTADVLFITGPHNIFNNIAADRAKAKCITKDSIEISEATLQEFGISKESAVGVSGNVVDFKTFLDNINVPSITGKWYCRLDLGMASKKQIEAIDKYIRSTSRNGVLVLVSQEFSTYRQYLTNRVIKNSTSTHLLQLSFPRRDTLLKLVIELFDKRGISIDENSAKLFIVKMGSDYDEYTTVINKISADYGQLVMTYEMMQSAMKGINKFTIDDFVYALTEPIGSDKISEKRRIYKIMEVLLKEYGASKLVKDLRYKINDIIEFRLLINKGIIPIKVHYSVLEAKEKLGAEHKFYKISDYKFKKMAEIASKTSLQDWFYIKLMLNNRSSAYDTKADERILYSIVHRTVLNEEMLNADIGLQDLSRIDIEVIDKIAYDEESLVHNGG